MRWGAETGVTCSASVFLKERLGLGRLPEARVGRTGCTQVGSTVVHVKVFSKTHLEGRLWVGCRESGVVSVPCREDPSSGM